MRRTDRPLSCRRVHVLLDAHLDGDLPRDRNARVVAHLADCDACRHEMQRAERLRGTLRALPSRTGSEALRAAVRARVRELPAPAAAAGTPVRRAAWRARLAGTWRPVAVAAVLAGVVFGAVRVLHRPVVENELTAQDVARAELQVRWVMARLGDISRRTGERVRTDVIQKGVVEPSERAVENALEHGVTQ
jgi:anti-sigma factor RsiW